MTHKGATFDDSSYSGLVNSAAWLRLMQLASPSLPTGSFAYSNGIETMVEGGYLIDDESSIEYLGSLLHVTLECLDLPRLLRMHRAWVANDAIEARRQSAWLYAAREGREVQAQERQMAAALRHVMVEMLPAEDFEGWRPRTYAEAFARAAKACGLNECACCLGYAYSWVESHTSAVARLIPLGPMATQRVLGAVLREIPFGIERACELQDWELGGATPGLGLATAQHETQHTRLFRS